MFLLERQCETVDNGAQNFQQLSDSIVSFGLIHELEENVVDRTSDVGPQVQEFSVNTVQGSLEEVTFPRIFGVK